MNITVKARNLNPQSDDKNISIDLPRCCPICGIAYAEHPKTSYIIDHRDSVRFGSYAYSLYFCPHCEKCFLVEYNIMDSYCYDTPLSTFINGTYPNLAVKTEFSEDISTLSPDFVKIYHQSEEAESAGLSEICGLGYRKSLEFLVKDYAIAFFPNDEEKIKSLALSPCINAYIDNPHIKALATASAWIGNDETHYVRKHENYNLAHLKAFIAAVVSCIDSEICYLRARQLLNTPKQNP